MTGVTYFIYGSLSEGMVHFNKIKGFLKSTQPAWIKGSAYRLQVGYPVLLGSGENLLAGSFVELENNALLVNLLDELHGLDRINPEKSIFLKTEVDVRLGDGSMPKAVVYFLNPRMLPKTATPIVDGDWQKSMRENPPLIFRLTERQKIYIKKLGQSSGRDIVPIDMALYRELMSLEIIRDKGRRLALTNFGHEVFRYLD